MEVRKVGVVGLGTMGAGIAQLAIEAGFATVGREVSMELAEKARDRTAHFLTRKVEKGQLEQAARDAAVERLSLTTEVADLADCDLIVEAITEDVDAKVELLAGVGAAAREAALATTTSSLSIAELAERSGSGERFFGLHVFNPVVRMELIELCLPQGLAPEVADRARA
jgi:3-hydroxybutyryl-CoA dehydrogenase